jgi:hypothetical protein
MNESRAPAIIIIGFLLVLTGAVFPFLMVFNVLESTLFLNLFSFSASTAGLFLGMIGGALYIRSKRKKQDDVEDKYK